MKKNYYKLLAFSILITWLSTSNAQEIPQRKHPGVSNISYKERYEMYKGLNLSVEQLKQLQVLSKYLREKTKAIRLDSNLSTQQKRTQLLDLKNKLITKRKQILTDQQIQQLEKNIQAHRKNYSPNLNKTVTNNIIAEKEKDPNGLSKHSSKNSFSGDRKSLNLTSEQKEKLKTLFTDNRRKIQLIKNNTSVSNTDKRKLYQKIQQQYQTELNSILTLEQQKNWEYNRQVSLQKKSNKRRA